MMVKTKVLNPIFDDEMKEILSSVADQRLTYKQVERLLDHLEWLQSENNLLGDAIVEYMDFQKMHGIETQNYLIYPAKGRGVGVIQKRATKK